ncbi:hypothetical protein G6F43_003904 [Rhizopus delemar]|nr:hypothetical protein G6F43_003904 [Rhizopus delemar]
MMDLSKRNIFTITSDISYLTMIKRLELSNNQLYELPDAIGYLHQLEYLSVSHNHLVFIPDTICHLSQLKQIDLSHNHLQSITPYLGHLSRLESIHLQHNQLSQLPFTLDGLSSLMSLDLSHNPISILPAQLIQLPFLRRLRLENCPLATSLDHFDTRHDPPSLREICARTLVPFRKKVQLTESLDDYLSSYSLCNHCHRPYFDSFVSRGRWLERNDLAIPLEYRLCSAHWSDESDRVFATFSSSPLLPPQGLMKPKLEKPRGYYKKLMVQKEDVLKKWRQTKK